MTASGSNNLRWRRGIAALSALLLLVSCTTDRTRRAYLRTIAEVAEGHRVPVVVIPGFGVSRLYDPAAERFVWGTPRSTLHVAYEDDLDLPFDEERGRFVPDTLVVSGFVGSRGPLNSVWHLSEALRRYGGYRSAAEAGSPATLYTFAWDWRLPADDNAASLARLVETIRNEHGDSRLKVDLVTHSAGGIVAMTYLRTGGAPFERPDMWDSGSAMAAGAVRRLVMLAPPAGGVIDPLRVVVDPERFGRRAFTPEMVATFPSLLELLPADGRFLVDEGGEQVDIDLHQSSGWEKLGVGIFASPDDGVEGGGAAAIKGHFARSLERAAVFRQVVQRSLPPSVEVSVLAGDCVRTPKRVLRRSDGSFAFYPRQLRPGEEHLAPLLFELGDGTVTTSSAAAGAPHERIQLFCDGHQGIATDPNVHRAILRALQAP